MNFWAGWSQSDFDEELVSWPARKGSMEEFLKHKITNAEGKAVPLQIQVAGMPLAGAVKQSEFGEGLFEILIQMQDQNGRSKAAKVTFRGSDCQAVFEEYEQEIHTSRNGLVIPRGL